MILFGNPLNASVRKVRCGAALLGLEVEEISVMKGSSDPVFRAASPAGIIPALRDRDLVVFGAYPILDYFDFCGGPLKLLPATIGPRARSLSIAQIADGPLAQAVSAIFQNCIFLPRFRGKPGNLKVAKHVFHRTLPEILASLERALGPIDSDLAQESVARLAIFSQCICLPMSGFTIDAERYPTIYRTVVGMMEDERIRPIAERDARLIGTDLKTVRQALNGTEQELAA